MYRVLANFQHIVIPYLVVYAVWVGCDYVFKLEAPSVQRRFIRLGNFTLWLVNVFVRNQLGFRR